MGERSQGEGENFTHCEEELRKISEWSSWERNKQKKKKKMGWLRVIFES